jgi:hypothetical protein
VPSSGFWLEHWEIYIPLWSLAPKADPGHIILQLNEQIQCSLDLPFFKGVEKAIDECGETRNPENHFF